MSEDRQHYHDLIPIPTNKTCLSFLLLTHMVNTSMRTLIKILVVVEQVVITIYEKEKNCNVEDLRTKW